MSDKRVSEMTDDEIRAMAGASDPLASTLAGIKDRAGVFAKLGPPRPAQGFGSEIYNAAIASAEDVPCLVAALEAVLGLADDWEDSPAGIEYPSILSDLREAITAALTGGTALSSLAGEDGES